MEWISVEYQLPEEYITVLVYIRPEDISDEYDNIFTAYRVFAENGPGYLFVSEKHQFTQVSHWMPLPEPPKDREL